MVLLFGGGACCPWPLYMPLSPAAGTATEVWLSYQLLAAPGASGMRYGGVSGLTGRSLMDAQRAVGRIVGRDTQCLTGTA